MKHLGLLAVVVLVSLLTGCATTKLGKVLDISVVNQLREGQKRNDVLALIGQPNETALGKTTVRDAYWVFDELKDNVSGNNGRLRYFTILYDDKHILLKSLYSEHEVPGGGDLQGFLVVPKFSVEIATKIQPQITKVSELMAWLGKPMTVSLDASENLTISWVYVQENRTGGSENKVVRVSVDDASVVIAYQDFRFEDYFKPLRQR